MSKDVIRITVNLPRSIWTWVRKKTYLSDSRSLAETIRQILAAAMAAEEEKDNGNQNSRPGHRGHEGRRPETNE